MERIILYNKDLQVLTGKSEKTCYRLMHKIRSKAGKAPDVPITLHEFCDYLQLRPEWVRLRMG